MMSQKKKDSVPGQTSIARFFRPTQVLAPKDPLQTSQQIKQEVPVAQPRPFKNAEVVNHSEKEVVKSAEKGKDELQGLELVGLRVSVFWPLEKSWFHGQVKKFNADKDKHFCESPSPAAASSESSLVRSPLLAM